ncbi:uncharacterized protein LOC133390026 [Rhineura floridana]|uniref:uncharacterized protein LOC133390026 n=1 Tax=Rhineura floridana TaxID=261503 RepID=UPI002AC843F4|nr:uncharacterized protein LOC133390026 [Rhineura floridana]
MDALVSHTAIYHICLDFGAILLLDRQVFTAPSLLFTLVSLSTIRPAVVAKEPHSTCEQIYILRGVQDARAVAGRLFSYPISPFAFQGKITHYKVTLASGSALPKWLEYNPNTNTLQGLPMVEESGEYRLTVIAYGEACGWKTPTAGANFALHVHNSVFVHEKEVGPNQNYDMVFSICSGALCETGVSVIFAEIIIHANTSLEIQKRLSLICTMAEYLHLDPFSLILTPFKSVFNKHFWNVTILAEDIRYLNTTKNHYVGLCWLVGTGEFAMLYELVQVLQHNVESNHLSQLLGYEIAGWRILKKEGNEKKHSRERQRRQLMATPGLVLKPTKMETLTILSATLLHTQSVIRPSESSSPLYEATKTPIATYKDAFFQSVISQKDLGPMDMQILLNVQRKTTASTIFQYLSSELSPSLMSASTEFEGKVSSRTPPISEQLHSQVPQQDVYSIPKKSKPKHCSTLYHLGFSMLISKTHMNTSALLGVTPSRRASLAPLSGEITRSLDYSDPYAQLTASGLVSEDTIHIAKLPLPSMSTLMNLRATSRLPFSSVVISLLSTDGSSQNQDLLSNYKHASETFMSSPCTTMQMEVPSWNTGFNLIGITSTLDSPAISSASAQMLGLLTDTRPSCQLYYSDNPSALAMYSIQQFSISLFAHLLEFGFLSRTNNIPSLFSSLSLSTPEELQISFGLSNILPMEELLSETKKVNPEVIKTHTHTSESFMTVLETDRLLFTKNKVSALTTTHMNTLLWKKQSHLIFVASSSTSISSSRFLLEDGLSYGMSQTSEWYSYDALLLTHPTEFAGTPMLLFTTDEFSSYDSSVIRTHMAYPDALQLDTSNLSLDSSFVTKINFQITMESTLELMDESIITSNKNIAKQSGFSVATLYHGLQDKHILTFTSYESPHGTGAIRTPLYPVSQIMPIGQTNNSPRVVNAIKWITATIGHKFSFSVPPDTFYDEEDGNTTQLILGINPIDGSPKGSESWLQFNSCYQTMDGYPLDNDFQYSPQEFLLFATDSGGLRTSNILTIEILRPTSIPCHIYTIRTKNSYHSFLRDRKRVNLFFEKLSKYLNAGCPGNLTLLHLKPGSTVITWYHNSFCTRTNWCAKEEIQVVLRKLGVPGGNINPHFVEAMLPAYKIDRIEEVAYGGNCSPIIKALNESLTSNRTFITLMDRHSWMRNIFSALLIGICTTIIVVLIVAFYYCKHRKIFFRAQCTSHGKNFFSYLEMDMLKSRKSPIVKQDVPPSAHLWLPVPTPSYEHLCRPNRNPVASDLPPPPIYRLPPCYGMEEPSQTHQDVSHRRYYPKARLH